jgi:hypothetical protein
LLAINFWGRCYDFKNILAEKIGEKMAIFTQNKAVCAEKEANFSRILSNRWKPKEGGGGHLRNFPCLINTRNNNNNTYTLARFETSIFCSDGGDDGHFTAPSGQ